MIDLDMALQLRAAGLTWSPAEGDAFAVPTSGPEHQFFIVSQLTVLAASVQGQPMITFHGSVEWALDYVLQADAVWLPSESQLRRLVEQHLPEGGAGRLSLERTDEGYLCRIGVAGGQSFAAATAEQAYGQGLLALLQQAGA